MAQKPEPLESIVTRMAEGAAGLVAAVREQTQAIKLRLTTRQFWCGVALIALLLVYVGWRLNEAGEDRTDSTKRVMVATIQCLYGGVQPADFDRCITGVLAGKPPPVSRFPARTTTTTPTVMP